MVKPKDLKRPFTWDRRQVLIAQNVLFVPECCDNYDAFAFPGWKKLFGRGGPISVEFCTGHGHWIVEQAAARPEMNWVAVEKRFDRVQRIWSKRANRQLKNLAIICGEAYTVTKHYFPSASIAEAYVHFPDPWPKQRHAKHRLLHREFLAEVARAQCNAAPFSLVTDDQTYMERFLSEVQQSKYYQTGFPKPHYLTEGEDYGGSVFERFWRREQRTIYHAKVSKCAF